MKRRPTLAVYWLSACGGCQATFLDLGKRLLELDELFEIVLFPLLMDGKEADVDRFEPGEIDLCLISGAIRNSHDVEMARRLRDASSVLVALGACSHLGSVLGLANSDPVSSLLETVYASGEAYPSGMTTPGGNELSLPRLEAVVRPLRDVVSVDFSIPGCPPERETLWEALQLLIGILEGRTPAPPAGAVLGAAPVSLCEECPREAPAGPVVRFLRPHEVEPDPHRCLLDQGLLCMGPATRGGCGAVCPEIGAGCRGCYGPLDGVNDQGARMLGALVALAGPRSFEGAEAAAEARVLADSVPDPVGMLYRFSFAASLLGRLVPERGEPPCDE